MVFNKKIKNIIFYCAIGYLCLVGALYFMQRSIIYFPSTQKSDVTPYIAEGVFDVRTKTIDGLDLLGWMKNPEPEKSVIIFFHGNASRLDVTLYKAAPYAKAGYGFLLAGYRGYESNPGKPSEQGFYRDARAWMQKLNTLGILPENIILYGESIGTGVAVQLATEFTNVQAVILESPYTSLPDVAAKTYFFIPVHLLMKDKFDSLSKIKKVTSPLFIIQGLEDQVIPPSFGQKLFAEANEPKEIHQLDGYGHNNMPDAVKSVGVLNFLNSLN